MARILLLSAMSTHYQVPASLPSDYALLSRYAGHPDGDEPPRRTETEDDEVASERTLSLSRRSSMPANYTRPQRPTIYSGAHPHAYTNIPMPDPLASENTPLLNPPIPRIDEALEGGSHDTRKLSILWEEARILTRYSLPVFGFVIVSLLIKP